VVQLSANLTEFDFDTAYAHLSDQIETNP
jgi:hypothetical protein